MRSKQFAALMALIAALSASADDLERQLSHEYHNHVLGLRASVPENGGDFDAAGHPLQGPTPVWTLHSGLLFIHSLHLSKGMLELQGDPVIRFLVPEPQAFILGPPVRIRIHLDQPHRQPRWLRRSRSSSRYSSQTREAFARPGRNTAASMHPTISSTPLARTAVCIGRRRFISRTRT
jgi:hypothetical protein